MFISKTPMIFLVLVFFLSFDHHIPCNEARSFPTKTTLQQQQLFSEAPDFRNGLHCPNLSKNDASFSSSSSACNPPAIHIAMTLDSHYLRGSVALVHSILTHTSCPENLFFHFIALDSSSTRTIESTFTSLAFKLHVFDPNTVQALISSSIRKALDTPLNYARNYLPELLGACVERVIYLDSDTVVVDDIAKLWSVSLSGSKVIAAPEYCHANFTSYFTREFWSDRELTKVFDGKKPCYFNTGVMVIDLGRWRESDYTERIEKWMRVHKEEKRIYELGSLPPFLLVFGGDIEGVDHRWNQHGLGGDNVVDSCRGLHAGPVSLLHWSGKGKPWVRLDSGRPCPVDLLWAPYDLYRHQHSSSRSST